jgi:hypothetical protein
VLFVIELKIPVILLSVYNIYFTVGNSLALKEL